MTPRRWQHFASHRSSYVTSFRHFACCNCFLSVSQEAHLAKPSVHGRIPEPVVMLAKATPTASIMDTPRKSALSLRLKKRSGDGIVV